MDAPKPKPTRGSRACTVCRRLKMKCEGGHPCNRCMNGAHNCVFEESNRGKRPNAIRKHDVLSKSIKKMEETLDSVIRSMNNNPQGSVPAAHRSPSSSPKLHSLPDNTLNPLGLLAEASLANSNNLPSPSLGVASRNYFKPGPMTILPLRRLYIEKQIHPEMLTFVTTDQVLDLFHIYFEHLHPLAYILDPAFHSPPLVCSRSPFLLTTICAVSSKFYTAHPDLHPRLTDLAKHLAFSVPANGYKSIEIVQAYLLLSLWGCGAAERYEMDKTWMLLGMAIRMATDLNLHRKTSFQTADTQNGKTFEMELHNRERTWLLCFILDRSLSSQMGKPYTIREDYLVRHIKEFTSSPSANETDIAISAHLQLQQIISHCLDFLYSGTDTPSGLQRNCDYMQVIKSFDAQLQAWWDEWGESRNWNSTYVQIAVDFYYNYACLVINSFGLQNALESLSSHSRNATRSSTSYTSASAADRINTSYFFSKVYNAAYRCATLVRDRFRPSGHLKYLPDSHFVQMSYAVLSLLKLIRPELLPYLSSEKKIISLAKEVADIMSDAAVNELHTPALYGHFLSAIIEAKVGGGSGGGGGGNKGGGGDTGEPMDEGGDGEMSPPPLPPSRTTSGGGYRTSPSSSRHTPSSTSQSRHTPSSSLTISHTPDIGSGGGGGGGDGPIGSKAATRSTATTKGAAHKSNNNNATTLEPTDSTASIVLSLSDYPFGNNSNGEMGPSPLDFGVFPGQHSASSASVSSGGLGLLGLDSGGDGLMGDNNNNNASSSLVGGVGVGVGVGGVGVGVPQAAGVIGSGLTMEDVLSSVFWDSMVVPGYNTFDGFSGGFVFGSGGSGLITPRQVPGTPHP